MKLTIENMKKYPGGNLVKFSSSAGIGIALCQEEIFSYNGKIVQAEIDIYTTFEIERNVNYTEAKRPNIELAGEMANSIVLKVEDLDADGMLYCRLADDCLIMVESYGIVETGKLIKAELSAFELELSIIGVLG